MSPHSEPLVFLPGDGPYRGRRCRCSTAATPTIGPWRRPRSNGENLRPHKVEDHLFRHPSTRNVQAFGIPDEKYGDEVCAWAVLRPGRSLTEEALREFCRGRIAHYKVPRHVRFVTEMPLTATGKPQKFRMRERMIEELGLVAG